VASHGAAGFIGSHLVERLLREGAQVVGMDNFATGHRRNLDDIFRSLAHDTPDPQARFDFIEGDIRDLDTCRRAVSGAAYVLHQAALGSVPRSIEDPLSTNAVNVDGFLNMLVAARDAGVERMGLRIIEFGLREQHRRREARGRGGRPAQPVRCQQADE
jgi:UDP-N-acetylglucosamine/UDP-N-acetylgalactosamine 4-epimerase